ncbi:MAG: phospho-sugar mutase [Peptococcaceae bacterium]|nr:phospho-sugar mutase [Peptococcaceae bacterium]
MNAQSTYDTWCARTDLTPDERAELAAMKDDALAITKAFGQTLSFGTAGLRGIMGMGTNCLNRFTIAGATAGIAEWLLETGMAGKPVVISTDSRLNHEEFARTTALVLAQYGFPVLLWAKPTATPVLSWSVRHFGCAAGIMITASHNPRDYNGYKAYDATGCQLLAADATMVTRHADAYFNGKPLTVSGDLDTLVTEGTIRLLDEELSDYLATIRATVAPLQKNPDTPLAIGYTPLHGVGGAPVLETLEAFGMTVYPVAEQFAPDGHFPTIATPNPELPVAYDHLFALTEEKDCDLLIATDPDSDRLGAAAKDKSGQWHLISGNQLGALLIDFLAETRGVASGDTIITTTVTSEFGKATARYHGYQLLETFTGFKYIGHCANDVVSDTARTFVLGYEESYGYLYGDHARDKDAIITAALVAMMAQTDKAQGHSLLDRLEALYAKVGAWADTLINLVFDPIPGQEAISDQVMRALRQDPPQTIATIPVKKTNDYLTGIDSLPKENVLQYILADGAVVCLRPSGTEPKMKCYISACAGTLSDAHALCEKIEAAFHTFVAHLKEDASS